MIKKQDVVLVGLVAVGVILAGGIMRYAQKNDIGFLTEASEGFQGL